MRVQLKGIHRVRWRLASGEFAIYYYAWRGGPRLIGKPGSPEFMRSYNEAVASRRLPAQGKLFTLIAEFRASSEYSSLSDATKRAYTAYLRMIEAEFGNMPIEALSDPEVRGEFKRWRDGMADTPRKADYAWTTLARVLSVAHDRGRIPVNPCQRGGRLYEADRTEKVWTEDDIARLLAVASPNFAMAALLALWTGQRQGDLLRLPWSAYDGKYIRLRQSKTGRRVTIPVSRHLKTILDNADRISTQILTNAHGRPWTSDGFRASWKKLCVKAGIKRTDVPRFARLCGSSARACRMRRCRKSRHSPDTRLRMSRPFSTSTIWVAMCGLPRMRCGSWSGRKDEQKL